VPIETALTIAKKIFKKKQMGLASFSVMNYCVDVRREVCSVVAHYIGANQKP